MGGLALLMLEQHALKIQTVCYDNFIGRKECHNFFYKASRIYTLFETILQIRYTKPLLMNGITMWLRAGVFWLMKLAMHWECFTILESLVQL